MKTSRKLLGAQPIISAVADRWPACHSWATPSWIDGKPSTASQPLTALIPPCAQVVDHYPYAACTDKEGLMNPNTYAASLGIKK